MIHNLPPFEDKVYDSIPLLKKTTRNQKYNNVKIFVVIFALEVSSPEGTI